MGPCVARGWATPAEQSSRGHQKGSLRRWRSSLGNLQRDDDSKRSFEGFRQSFQNRRQTYEGDRGPCVARV